MSPSHTQAVQNRLYNDHAALYYLLLSRWEKGQLQIPPSAPQIVPHHRLSQSGISSAIPQISINNSEVDGPETSPTKNPWHKLTFPEMAPQEESEAFLKDPNLARYLQQGRRHTLAAAHNFALVPPEELKRLREISECSSSQTSSGVGSCTQLLELPTTLQQALSCSTGVDSSLQSSVGSMNAPNRHYLPIPSRGPRLGRRVSDGGPYAAAYKVFMERRSPLLAQLNSTNSIDRQDSSGLTGTNSVKRLLLEQRAHATQYGQLPSPGWIQQVSAVR